MRRRAKVDANQREIVKALRKLGCSVQSLASLGAGCPDLLVGTHGVNLLLEVKDGSLPPSRRKLTIEEELWHKYWRGSVRVIESVDEALAAIRVWT
jgi:Holliday junction resolvase